MRCLNFAFASLLVAAPVWVSASAPAWAIGAPDFSSAVARLAAHHAVYRLSLDGAGNASVASAKGGMDYQVLDACDGWATQQRLSMDVTNNDGQTLHMVSDYSTWEAKDGSKLQFRLRQTTDTAVTVLLAGEADIAANGAGTIHYTEPKPATLKLAPGTLFPMAHTAHIMALAAAGQKFITLPLFDGTSDSGAENTFIVVTGAAKPGADAYPQLAVLPSDNVAISFFDQQSDGSHPDSTVTMRYWTNGVADNLKLDFGDFTMDGHLVQFTPLSGHC